MNISIPLEQSVEFIEVTPISPLISKCEIKVCYVQDEPNRNGSIITKETAREMANSLPGCPIVGFYSKEKEDFEGHNQEIKIGDGNIEIKDTTIPYGFVDMNPKVWFQKFADGPNQEIHEYLMTEGYIWTGQFPEAKRVITKGNNQSMELDDRFIDGNWAEDENGYYSFFIISDAIISKLCILGEEVEPCFEGSQIKAHFSLDDFSEKLKFMANELKEILGEGGQEQMNEEQKFELENEEVVEKEFEKKEEEKTQEEDYSLEQEEEVTEEFKKEEKTEEEEEEEYRKKRQCSLNSEDVDYAKEYVSLFKEHTVLEEKFTQVEKELEKANAKIEELRQFKLDAERQDKERMIDSFYMLDDEDKKDICDNIDSYSVDDIEAKLSVICVRKKVNFDKHEEKNEDELVYNTNFSLSDNSPEWLKAVEAHKQNNKI